MSLDHIKEAKHRDATYQKLLMAVKSGQGKEDPDLVPYTSVWEELGQWMTWYAGGTRW